MAFRYRPPDLLAASLGGGVLVVGATLTMLKALHVYPLTLRSYWGLLILPVTGAWLLTAAFLGRRGKRPKQSQ